MQADRDHGDADDVVIDAGNKPLAGGAGRDQALFELLLELHTRAVAEPFDSATARA